VAATGRPGHWLPHQVRLAPTAAATLGVAALAADLLLLITLGPTFAARRFAAFDIVL
jgi:hypothetical protein